MRAVTHVTGSSADWRSYWNERYLREPSFYGNEPNVFVAEVVASLDLGTALDAACGQGRNAVWLAGLGHTVTALDLSNVAVDQGRDLAARAGVEVDFRVADFLAWDPPGSGYDLVLLSYLQLPEGTRMKAHRCAVSALAPGGRLLVVAHHADNIEFGVGGPQYPEVLYDEAMLASDFAGLDTERNERVVRRVDRDDLQGEAIDVLFLGRAAPVA